MRNLPQKIRSSGLIIWELAQLGWNQEEDGEEEDGEKEDGKEEGS